MEKLQETIQEMIAEMKEHIRKVETDFYQAKEGTKSHTFLQGQLIGLREGYQNLVHLDNELEGEN